MSIPDKNIVTNEEFKLEQENANDKQAETAEKHINQPAVIADYETLDSGQSQIFVTPVKKRKKPRASGLASSNGGPENSRATPNKSSVSKRLKIFEEITSPAAETTVTGGE
jgi:hypothetical protein